MTHLFSPLKLRSITLRNRLGVSPMCQYVAKEGVPTNWHVSHLTARAIGGAGLVVAEATGVVPEGRISPGCTGLWNSAQVDAWRNITEQLKSYGAVPGIQIAHAGRKASSYPQWKNEGASLPPEENPWQTVAPSAIPFGYNITHTPKEATKEDIQYIKNAFVAAAKRAVDAGFQVLEVHAAHGYLLHEFLSPVTNKRTDEYGGSAENRNRLLFEVVDEVRKVWPQDLPLFVRITGDDWLGAEGITPDDAVFTARGLKERGVDLVDVSSGFISPQSFLNMKFAPGFQVHLSEKIRKEAGVTTSAVGGIYSGKQAEEILSTGKADLIFSGTQFLRNPFFAHDAALELGIPPKEASQLLPLQTGYWLSRF